MMSGFFSPSSDPTILSTLIEIRLKTIPYLLHNKRRNQTNIVSHYESNSHRRFDKCRDNLNFLLDMNIHNKSRVHLVFLLR